MESYAEYFNRPGTIQHYALTIFAGILIYFIATRIVHAVFRIIIKKYDQRALHWRFFERVIKGALIFVLAYEVLSSIPVLDKLVTTLVASSTILVAAVGFASQESMSNIISGMFLSIFKPFYEEDRVRLHSVGIVGIIEDVSLRHTIIKTAENSRIIVPNAIMNKEIVENSSFHDKRIINFLDVKITYESNVGRAMEIIREETLNHPNFVDWRSESDKSGNVPVTSVLVRDISRNCVELRVSVWTADIDSSFVTCSDIRFGILRRFQTENIQMYDQAARQKFTVGGGE